MRHKNLSTRYHQRGDIGKPFIAAKGFHPVRSTRNADEASPIVAYTGVPKSVKKPDITAT